MHLDLAGVHHDPDPLSHGLRTISVKVKDIKDPKSGWSLMSTLLVVHQRPPWASVNLGRQVASELGTH